MMPGNQSHLIQDDRSIPWELSEDGRSDVHGAQLQDYQACLLWITVMLPAPPLEVEGGGERGCTLSFSRSASPPRSVNGESALLER